MFLSFLFFLLLRLQETVIYFSSNILKRQVFCRFLSKKVFVYVKNLKLYPVRLSVIRWILKIHHTFSFTPLRARAHALRRGGPRRWLAARHGHGLHGEAWSGPGPARHGMANNGRPCEWRRGRVHEQHDGRVSQRARGGGVIFFLPIGVLAWFNSWPTTMDSTPCLHRYYYKFPAPLVCETKWSLHNSKQLHSHEP
jgi:hypothetical protein